MRSSIDDFAVIVSAQENNRGMNHLIRYVGQVEERLEDKTVRFGNRRLPAPIFMESARMFTSSVDMATNPYLDMHPDEVPDLTNEYIASMNDLSDLEPSCFEIPYLSAKILMAASATLEDSLAPDEFDLYDADDDDQNLAVEAFDMLTDAEDHLSVALANFSEYQHDVKNTDISFYRSAMLYHLGIIHLRKADLQAKASYDPKDDPAVADSARKSVAVFEELFTSSPFVDREMAVQALDDWGKAMMLAGDPEHSQLGLMYRSVAHKERSSTGKLQYRS